MKTWMPQNPLCGVLEVNGMCNICGLSFSQIFQQGCPRLNKVKKRYGHEKMQTVAPLLKEMDAIRKVWRSR